MIKYILLTAFLLFTGCSIKEKPVIKKSVPDWYLTQSTVNGIDIIDIGEGNTYKEATINALSNISNRFGVKLQHKHESNVKYSSETNYYKEENINKSTLTSSYLLEYRDYEVLKKDFLNNKYYVSIKINKETYASFLLTKISSNLKKIDYELESLKTSSLLNRLKEYKNIKIEIDSTLELIEVHEQLDDFNLLFVKNAKRFLLDFKQKIYKEENNKFIQIEYQGYGSNFKTQFETFLTSNGYSIKDDADIRVVLNTNKTIGKELNSYEHSISFFEKLNNIKTIYIVNKTFNSSNEMLIVTAHFKKELEEHKKDLF